MMQHEQIDVIPAAGKRVRDPETGLVMSPEGRTVPGTMHWLRMLAQGAITRRPASPSPKPKRAEALGPTPASEV